MTKRTLSILCKTYIYIILSRFLIIVRELLSLSASNSKQMHISFLIGLFTRKKKVEFFLSRLIIQNTCHYSLYRRCFERSVKSTNQKECCILLLIFLIRKYYQATYNIYFSNPQTTIQVLNMWCTNKVKQLSTIRFKQQDHFLLSINAVHSII